MKVVFHGETGDTVIADATEDQILRIEGNIYFSPSTVKMEYLHNSDTEYTCPWKGESQYHHGNIEGTQIEDLAWSYPEPKEGSTGRVSLENDGKFDGNFAGFVAFDLTKEGVELVE